MVAVRFHREVVRVCFAVWLSIFPAAVRAEAPAGHYDSAVGFTGAALRAALHDIIDDHQRFPYTSTATDTWDILSSVDEDPVDAANVLTIYRNASVEKSDHSQSTGWNREHTWPSSYGFTNDGGCNYPYTDLHQLRAANPSYNSSRGNRLYDWCSSGCAEYPSDGGADSSRGSGAGSSGSWQVREERRGDIARGMLYLDVRYEGGVHGATGCGEPDLILTDERALIVSNSSANESVAYMGILSTLVEWHLSDPVDAEEMARNDTVHEFQGNRNPFVDHPEYVCEIFPCAGADSTPPAAPDGLAASPGGCRVLLSWTANDEPDLAGYNVYRSDVSGGPYVLLNAGLLLAAGYEDATVVNGVTYHYVVTAVDTSGNDSGTGAEVTGMPDGAGSCGGSPTSDPWINEVHYDNSSSDTGEGVEVAGPAGLDLGGWQLVPYNGNGGRAYRAASLTGTLSDQSGGFGTLWFPISGLQNGAPDGIALVDDQGDVVQFLSYEGILTATNGVASGMTSTDIGVSELGGTAVGDSLQLTGSGIVYGDFSWQAPAAASPGTPNAGQSFTDGGDLAAPSAPSGLAALAGDATVTLDWLDSTEGDLAGYDVFRGTSAGGPYARVNTTVLVSSEYSDSGVGNGTAYFYVVRAVDTAGNVSGDSVEVSALPQDATAPAAPAGVGAAVGDGAIDLDWSDSVEVDLAGYRVYRATSVDGPYAAVNATLLTVSGYTDSGLENGVTYFYLVTALDTADNESLDSEGASATPLDRTAPGAPAGLVAIDGDARVCLDWAGASEADLAGYNIYGATASGGPYALLNDELLSSSSFLDDPLTNGTAYFYIVTAVDVAGNESAESNEATATPLAPTLFCPDDVEIDCAGPQCAIDYATPVAMDRCGLAAPVVCDPPPGTLLACGSHTITCTVTGATGQDAVCQFTVTIACVQFIRGDANGDGRHDLSDPVFVLLDLFVDSALSLCDDALDANDDGNKSLSDAIYLLSWLFAHTEPPPAPLPTCGPDPTEDELGCESFAEGC